MSRASHGMAVAAALLFGGWMLAATPAAAAPMLDPGVATTADINQAKPEQVRWVCNRWGRCWWRPNYYYAPRFYGPPRFYGGPRFYGRPYYRRGWGYRPGWRRW
ncbi:MAG: hypothetical protein QM651_07785 [Rhodoblastus sp.]